MAIFTSYIELSTKGKTDIIDITDRVASSLDKAALNNGIVTIFVSGSTGAITTIEYEPALVSDIKKFFEELIPSNIEYEHDKTWGDANGYSHLRASLLGPSLTIPFLNKKLTLGKWQQIIFIDFDNTPRERKLIVQFTGE